MSVKEELSKIRIKSFFQFGTVNVLRNLLGLLRAKIVALWFGGMGVGIIGQYIAFFNLQSKAVVFGATASMINSYHMSEERHWDIKKVYFYHLVIILIINVIFTISYLINIEYINNVIFAGEVKSDFMLLILIVGIFYSISTFLEMIIQAQKNFKVLSFGRNISIFAALFTCIPMIYFFNLSGILYNLIILYLSSFVYFFLILKKHKVISPSITLGKDFPIIKYIIKVSIIDLTRSFLVIGSILLGRTIIVNLVGMVKNGYIQSIWSIANYINVFSTGFMVYYFPLINSQQESDKLKEELNSSFLLLIYLLFPLIIVLLLFPNQIIKILYTNDFLIVSDYLKYFMIAKFIEIYYYFYTINFLGRNQFRNYLLLETLRSFFFIIIIWIFVRYFDLKGAAWAILSTEIFSLFVVHIILLKERYLKLEKSNDWLFLKMLFLLIIISVIPNFLGFKLIVILIYLFLFLNPKYYLQLVSLINK